MYQFEQGIKESQGSLVSGPVHTGAVGRFDDFKIPGAELIPEELIDSHQGVTDAELAEIVLHLGYGLCEQIAEPADCRCRGLALRCVRIHLPALYETEGIPHLAAEIASLLYL